MYIYIYIYTHKDQSSGLKLKPNPLVATLVWASIPEFRRNQLQRHSK